MDADRWTTIQTLFEAALDRDLVEREVWLRDACGDDDDLYREVASLLQTEPHRLFEGSAADAVDLSDLLSREGERVGPYRLAEEIGRGGMGAVYRADRVDGQFDQTVALKLIKPGMDSEAVLRRFEQERQILARLQHPGIASLLDGGLTAEGRPYLAMEFVQGEPVTAYCDRHGLGVDARVDLFRQVCDAVSFAHRSLVVHRDLKPSNVLVTAEGTVKLLDFGIAKVLEGDEVAEPLTVLTAPEQRVLTPEYAAPEQVRGEPVSTATDVYALGVLLYELLAGQRPYSFDARTPGVIEHVVATIQPPRPSTVVEDAPTTHGTPTERLRRQLAGDLDVICLTALRKEPERRYGSVEALADDLRRHQESLPVLAQPDTMGYRVRTFARRHRVGLGATLAAVLAVGLVTALAFARVSQERDRAELEAEKATEVAAFLEDLFTSSDPAESLGADVTARDLLSEGAERIENELANQPEVQAQMYATIGRVYESLGLLEEADTTLHRSLDLHHAVDSDPPIIARVQTDLSSVYVSQSNFDAADSLLQLALATQQAAYPEPHENLARSLEVYGDLLIERGDYPDAEAPYREALAIQRALHGDDHSSVASLLSDLGVSYSRMGRYEDAVRTHEEALAMHRRIHGDLHPATTESLREASTSHRRLDNFDRAEVLIREAIALDSALVGLEHPNLGEDYYQYASLLSDQGRFDEATAMFERSLAVDKATLGENHPYIAITLGDLGQVRQRAGDRPGAIVYFRRGVEMARRVLPPDHPQLAGLVKKLGEALSYTDQIDEAERLIRESLAITQARYGEDHVEVLTNRSALGSFFTRTGQHEEAIEIHRDVLERRRRTQGDSSAITARSYYNLAGALRSKGTPEALAEARSVAAETVERYRAVFPEESREVGYALMEQADVLRASGDLEAAEATYREAGRVFEASLGPDHPILGRIERSIAAVAS